jgi:hypothetical protein
MRRTATTALLTALLLASPATLAAPARAGTAEVLYHNLGGPGVEEPSQINTAFNSSPYYRDLTWTGWGGRRTVGRGVLDNSCGACSGQEVIDARLVFKRVHTCWDGTLVYKRARAWLTYEDGSTATTKVVNLCATDYS